MSERYPHRNGETEPPTEAGLYWFFGKHREQVRDFPNRGGILRVTRGRMTEYRKPGTVHPRIMPTADLAGKWWGPVVPPWGEE